MKRPWILALLMLALPVLLTAQGRVNIRLATVAPDGSVWTEDLEQMAAEWQQASNGLVRVRIFPGGTAGDDSKVVDSLRAGARVDAAALTTGLATVDKAFNIFSVPFFFESNAELYAVLEAMESTLTRRLGERGLTFVAWGVGGWVQFFSTEPVRTLDDLRRVKLFTSVGEDDMMQWYKNNGFNPVPSTVPDVLPRLSLGTLTGMPSPPYAALAFQWYTRTPYMLDIEVAPIVGAIVIRTAVWDRIPAPMRAEMRKSARAMEARLKQTIPAQDREAIAEMRRRNLTVTEATGEEWTRIGESLSAEMRGGMVPAEIYDLAKRARDAYRSNRHP